MNNETLDLAREIFLQMAFVDRSYNNEEGTDKISTSQTAFDSICYAKSFFEAVDMQEEFDGEEENVDYQDPSLDEEIEAACRAEKATPSFDLGMIT